MSLTDDPSLSPSLRGRVLSFIKRHWPVIKKGYKKLLYTTRAALLIYVAMYAYIHQIYFFCIAFLYFAFVHYFDKYFST